MNNRRNVVIVTEEGLSLLETSTDISKKMNSAYGVGVHMVNESSNVSSYLHDDDIVAHSNISYMYSTANRSNYMNGIMRDEGKTYNGGEGVRRYNTNTNVNASGLACLNGSNRRIKEEARHYEDTEHKQRPTVEGRVVNKKYHKVDSASSELKRMVEVPSLAIMKQLEDMSKDQPSYMKREISKSKNKIRIFDRVVSPHSSYHTLFSYLLNDDIKRGILHTDNTLLYKNNHMICTTLKDVSLHHIDIDTKQLEDSIGSKMKSHMKSKVRLQRLYNMNNYKSKKHTYTSMYLYYP